MSVWPEPASDERGTMIACPSCGFRVEASTNLWIDFDADMNCWVYGLSDQVEVNCCNCSYPVELPREQMEKVWNFVAGLERSLAAESAAYGIGSAS